MDLNDAVLVHTRWKIRLKSFLAGTSQEPLKAEQVARDNLCELGKWIYSQTTPMTNHQEFEQLQRQHAMFHKCAARVISLANAGKTSDAEQLLSPSGEFTRLSISVVSAIQDCKKIVN